MGRWENRKVENRNVGKWEGGKREGGKKEGGENGKVGKWGKKKLESNGNFQRSS